MWYNEATKTDIKILLLYLKLRTVYNPVYLFLPGMRFSYIGFAWNHGAFKNYSNKIIFFTGET